MTAFNPATAYAGNHAFLGFVEATSWERNVDDTLTTTTGFKAKRGPIESPDLVSVAAGLGLSSDAAAIVVWQATATTTFDPKAGQILDLATSGRWLIKSTHASRFSNWVCLCEKEVVNVG